MRKERSQKESKDWKIRKEDRWRRKIWENEEKRLKTENGNPEWLMRQKKK